MMQEVIYGSDQELPSGLSSEKPPSPELPVQVQGMASSVYSEFQRMMSLYGEDVIKGLMPLVVTILETLDHSLTEYNESLVELEMLKDDNEQLATQYERERQLRRVAEQRLMESEDVNETTTREIRDKASALESNTHMLELKCKNYSDQVDRLHEREAELKKEYGLLHDRHTEMIQAYMEHIEKTKTLQHQSSYSDISQSPHQNKRDITPSLTSPSLDSPSSLNGFSTEPRPNQMSSPIVAQPDHTSTPGCDRFHSSIKDEIPKSLVVTPTTPSVDHEKPSSVELTQEDIEKMAATPTKHSDHQGAVHKMSKSHVNNAVLRKSTRMSDASTATSTAQKADMPVKKDEGSPSGESDGAMWVSDEVKEMLENGEFELDRPSPDGDEDPHMKKEEVESSTGIENAAFETAETANASSLYVEMSQQDLDDVDEGADILAHGKNIPLSPAHLGTAMFDTGNVSDPVLEEMELSGYAGMSKEVENLLQENSKLLATKNALNVVKDDLIQQVDQLTTQHAMLKEQLNASEKAKANLQGRLQDLEGQLVKLQKELDNISVGGTRNSMSKQSDEEDMVPMSQRKRFTRVEMARVLMERNQYKERLMELQEAVRWTETLRASRNHPDLSQSKNKSKSSIFQFFSRLFTSNNSSGDAQVNPSSQSHIRRSAGSDLGLSVAYNAPMSKIIPRSRSSTASLYGRSPTIDTLRESSSVKQEVSKKEVASRLGDNSRLQACGWSLPNSPASPKEGSRTVPVPVYCGPLQDQESSLKVWCAAEVNIAGGLTKNGGNVIGTGSVFYDDSSDCALKLDTEKPVDLTPDVAQLNEELQLQQDKIRSDSRTREAVCSYIWLVSDDSRSGPSAKGSIVSVIDAREPNRCLKRFSVGNADTHILCITSLPGATEEDYSRHESNEETDSVYYSAGDSMLGITQSPTDFDSSAPDVDLPTSHGDGPTSDVQSSQFGSVEKVLTPTTTSGKGLNEDNMGVLADGVSRNMNISMGNDALSRLQPTMWLGSQNGFVYVHPAINNWAKCLYKIRLKDSVLAIVHCNGRALAALADGTVAILRRDVDGAWDLTNYYLLDLGRPHHAIRCMSVVYDRVWCGYRNKIHIVEPISMKIETSFDAHPRKESQVRQLSWAGDGVWVSIRLDSTVRLYHARSLQHLQDVDIEPYVSKVLGSGKLGFSFVRITSLMISSHRLWIGTGNGVVMSVPLSEDHNIVDSTFGKAVLAARSSASLQRRVLCIKHQDTIARYGVLDMVCLVCKKNIVRDESAASVSEQCACRTQGVASKATSIKGRIKLSKRAGRKLKLKSFWNTRGSKSNYSGPVLSTAVKNSERPGGVVRVYSDPVSDKITPGTFIPYCSMANAQLSFHGYREAVKFFVAVPGCVTQSSITMQPGMSAPKSSLCSDSEAMLVLSGGEGYVDFRNGDLGAITPNDKLSDSSTLQHSHIIVWQLTSS